MTRDDVVLTMGAMTDTHEAHHPRDPHDGPDRPDGPDSGARDRTLGRVLAAGGALFFVGGGLHPHDDPPGLTVREHLRVMFEDPAWYPSHAVLLGGMVLMAAALVGLARGRALADVPRARTAAVVAAWATVAATAGMVLHLVAAVESDRIASGGPTPLVDAHLVAETVTVPAFGLAVAALAVVGARTRTLGNRPAAVLGLVGGVGYALAGATFLLTDALDPLFPLAGAVGLWAVVAGLARPLSAPSDGDRRGPAGDVMRRSWTRGAVGGRR